MKIKLYTYKTQLLFIIILCAKFSFAQDCSTITLNDINNPGIFEVASLNETDDIRNGPDYRGATIYYPTNATPPFASIVIVPGYLAPQSSIQSWGPYLASHGFITMTIGTNNIFDNPVARKNALLDAIETIKQENTRTNSPLIGKIDTAKFAVSGWSMGGGGAQLAAAEDSTLNAVVALCPWLEYEQLTATELDNLKHAVPTLIFSAELDQIAPPSEHANIQYEYTPETTPKLIYELNNEGHSVANRPSGGQGSVGKIAVSWLKQYLIGDSCYCPLRLDVPSTASDYRTNVDCPELNIITSNNDVAIKNSFRVQLYPNPSKGNLNLEVKRLENNMRYEIISLDGTNVVSGFVLNQLTKIEIQNLAAGIYIINIISQENSEKTTFVVL